MTPEILIVLSILTLSMVLLVTEWIPMEVTALLVLAAVALTGLVPPADALAGFSNPAVVTIWAVFILSGGLTHTGVANILGRLVSGIAGTHETVMIAVIMTVAGILSGIMNNVAVAALMLPVVMDIARNTGMAPSRLLMPLAFGTLLGGMTTQIGTPPNILVTEALRENGFEPFSFFDFTPIGLILLAAGTVFMAIAGRYLLPGEYGTKNDFDSSKPRGWHNQRTIAERLFHARVPFGSVLAGKTLSEIRLGSILGWNVICIDRNGGHVVAPGPDEHLRPGDLLIVEGRAETMRISKDLLKMKAEKAADALQYYFPDTIRFYEASIPAVSPLEGKTLNETGFSTRHNAKVLAIRVNGHVQWIDLQDMALPAGARLLLAGKPDQLENMTNSKDFETVRFVEPQELQGPYRIHENLVLMEVPGDSDLSGKTLVESRLGEVMGNHVLGIVRGDDTIALPEPSTAILAGDRLITGTTPSIQEVLRGIQSLQIQPETGHPDMAGLLSRDTGLVEAILAPGASIEGKTLRQIHFREKYGLVVLALWRRGKLFRTNLKDMALEFGDAIMLFGSGSKLRMLGREPEFIVLSQIAEEAPRTEKMPVALAIMAAILLSVVMGWVPIYIAAVAGGAIMILTGCLTMQEAYRQIEWKAVFLIAGMLPLGTAMDQTGAAMMAAQWTVSHVGAYGPEGILLGLSVLTILATCVLPIPAVVVLMIPVAINTAATMGFSPHSLMMAVSMAASASFITPISHPAKLMVMGPGGYRFRNYLKAGIPLTLVILAVMMIALPFLWPLAP